MSRWSKSFISKILEDMIISKKYMLLLVYSFLTAIFLGLISHYLILEKYSIIESVLIYFPVGVFISFINQTQRDRNLNNPH